MTRRFAPLLILLMTTAQAGAETQDCAALAERAAQEQGIPAGLMTAIARAESGRADGSGSLQAWPWTLNQGGRGSFHDSREAALQYLGGLLDKGVTNVDIGCMQINYRWHHNAFASVGDMMDPAENTRYAARFLRALYDRLGSWDQATAAYHSLDAKEGEKYLTRVTELGADGGAVAAAAPDTALDAPGMAAVAARVAGLFVLPTAPLVALAGLEAAGAVVDAPPPASRPAPPPYDLKDTPVALLDPDAAPPRLQARWDEVRRMRDMLAALP